MKSQRILLAAFLSIGVIACGVFFTFVDEAHALPTFARKYRTSCTTCHIGFFKLNPFGESFRQNGYVIPGGQNATLVKEEPVSLGAEAWKRVWPEAVWPGAIPSTVPVSFYAHQRLFIDENKDPAVNFKFPHEFKMFIGGTLGENYSFWGEHNLQSSTLNRIFFRFNDLFSEERWGKFGVLPEDAFNVRIGRLDVGTLLIPLNVRRTINKAAPYTYEVGSAAATKWDFSDLQSGVEANGVIRHRFLYAAGVVNGLTTGGTPAGVEDNNDAKDLYYRVAYKYGGLSFDGQDWASDEEGLRQTNNWVDNAVTVGQFGYWGTTTVSTAPMIENPFWRVGGDVRVNFGNLDLYGAVVAGRDDRPDSTNREIDTLSSFAQADYVIFPWLQIALGYENVTYDKAFKRDTDAIIASLFAWPAANIKTTVEGKVFPEDSDGASQLLFDLTYAF
ncbi:MAG: hypothetical protein HY590_04605 [Candidatus Omnitrophica bacterium]|nr:hypothetical protein [Candidatus Omnitrophota bacterium]